MIRSPQGVISLLSGSLLIVLTSVTAVAQEAVEKTSAPVVVFPVIFDRNSGTETSRKAAMQALREVMSKAGHPILSDTVAASTWKKLRIPTPTHEDAPNTDELTRFGRAMKARYVLGADFDFHSRSIWVNLGPKTIATATVDVYLFDVARKKIVYSQQHVQGRSDERTETLKLLANVLVTPIFTAVSGGPKTPHERRAAQIAAARAMRGWVDPNSVTGGLLVGGTWSLVEIAYNDDKIVRPMPGENVTLQFTADNRVAGSAGINRFSGICELGKDRALKIGALKMTRAANPPDSIADIYIKELQAATSYLTDKEMLILQLPADTGVMKFRRATN